jgi:hypothetical protein
MDIGKTKSAKPAGSDLNRETKLSASMEDGRGVTKTLKEFIIIGIAGGSLYIGRSNLGNRASFASQTPYCAFSKVRGQPSQLYQKGLDYAKTMKLDMKTWRWNLEIKN